MKVRTAAAVIGASVAAVLTAGALAPVAASADKATTEHRHHVGAGKVITSENRVARIDKRGCIFLTYTEAYGVPVGQYDAGDGEFFCAR